MRVTIFIVVLLLIASIVEGQTKPDSTNFKNLVRELQFLQAQKARTDSVSIKLQGAIEYTYSKAVEEQKKLQPKGEVKK